MKTGKITSLLIAGLAVIVALQTSCKKDSTASPSTNTNNTNGSGNNNNNNNNNGQQLPANYMSATINGTTYSNDTAKNDPQWDIVGGNVDVDNNAVLTVASGSTLQVIFVPLGITPAVGTYTLNGAQAQVASYSTGTSRSNLTTYSTTSLYTGTLTVTSVANNKLTGTYSFTGQNNYSGNTVTVTGVINQLSF